MAEQTNAASSRRSSANRKPKKNQIPYGFLTVALIGIVAVFLNFKSSNVAFFWLTGSAFGFILKKGFLFKQHADWF